MDAESEDEIESRASRPAPRLSRGAQALRYLTRNSTEADVRVVVTSNSLKSAKGSHEKQRRRDRRISRMQRKTLRDKRQAAAVLPQVASQKSLRALEMKAFIQERRDIWQDVNPSRARGSSERIEHPAVNGFALQPVLSQWDSSKQNPIFFGSLEQQKANSTFVEVDLKIFGLLLEDWNIALQGALEEAVWSLAPESLGIPRNGVRVVFTEEIGGENLRRVAEKVDRRSQVSSVFREHLANLVREDGGVINVKVHVITPATADAIEQLGRYCLPRNARAETSARRLMTLDIPQKEAAKAARLAAHLSRHIVNGDLQGRLRRAYACAKAFSLAHNHIPRPGKGLESEDYALAVDTPRKRKTRGRMLNFETSKLLATGRQLRDDDVTAKDHRKEFATDDGSSCRYVHPCFCQREVAHVRPSPRLVNPIFWGQWACPLVRDLAAVPTKVSPKLLSKHVHPALAYDDRDYAPNETQLHSERSSYAEDPKSRHPMFQGYVRCGPDCNELVRDAEERRRASEAAEAKDDEAFVASLARRNQRSRRVRRDEEEEQRIKKWIEDTKKRNLHPATRGYKQRSVPVFAAEAAKYLHPSCFGYETGPACILPPFRVTRVIHPACVGYELVAQEPHTFTSAAAKVVNPMFFGLSLHKGPRYEPPMADNDVMAKRKLFLEDLTSNPTKRAVALCVVCFGENSVGCPRCWVPAAWEVSGTKLDDLASDITKTLAKNPLLNSKRGRSRRQASSSVADSPAHSNESDNATKKAKRFRLKMAAKEALVNRARLLSVADIRMYRQTKANFVTVYIKSLPSGKVTRLTLESSRTVRDLYFMYRSNARREVATLPRFWIVVPIMQGLVCLDDTRQIHDDMNCAFEPGALTLEEYGLFKKDGEICMFQVKDLHHPHAGVVARSYIAANVNLARRLDLEIAEDAERQESELPGRRRRSKFEEDMTSSVSIKTRINAMRVANNRDDSGDASGAALATQIHVEILNKVRFDLLFRPDELPPPVPEEPYTPSRFNVANDALQLPLVREMRDVIVRQERAWRDHIAERELVIKRARDAKLARALAQRKEDANKTSTTMRVRDKPKKTDKSSALPAMPQFAKPVHVPTLCTRKITFTDDA